MQRDVSNYSLRVFPFHCPSNSGYYFYVVFETWNYSQCSLRFRQIIIKRRKIKRKKEKKNKNKGRKGKQRKINLENKGNLWTKTMQTAAELTGILFSSSCKRNLWLRRLIFWKRGTGLMINLTILNIMNKISLFMPIFWKEFYRRLVKKFWTKVHKSDQIHFISLPGT